MSDKQVTKYTSFQKFYPFYLSEHIHPTNRLLHFIGTGLAWATLLYLIFLGKYYLFFLAFIPGYASAWIGHFIFEKNRPATFTYPFYSLIGDQVMFYQILTGKLRIHADPKVGWAPR